MNCRPVKVDGVVVGNVYVDEVKLVRFKPQYILARAVRRSLPEVIANRLLSRRSTPVDELYENAHSCSCRYAEALVVAGLEKKLAGVVALETGTGLYNPLAAPLMLAGVERYILLEPYAVADFDQERFQSRFKQFLEVAENDSEFPLKRTCTSKDLLPQLFQTAGITGPKVEITLHFWEDTGLPDASLNLLLSASVLEHLRNPEAVIAESARVVKPGGYMINIVDMRDHFFRYPMEMLNYPDWLWKLLTTRAGGSGYQNRWRLSQWVDALRNAGFETTTISNITLEKEKLNVLRRDFHTDYANLPDDDLQVLHATLISRRL